MAWPRGDLDRLDGRLAAGRTLRLHTLGRHALSDDAEYDVLPRLILGHAQRAAEATALGVDHDDFDVPRLGGSRQRDRPEQMKVSAQSVEEAAALEVVSSRRAREVTGPASGIVTAQDVLVDIAGLP